MADDKNKQRDAFSGDEEEGFGLGSGDTDDFGDSDFGALTAGDTDSELGNLPPLSDFESSAGDEDFESDSGLPPLGSIKSDAGIRDEDAGGLPSIDEISVETPVPTGGAIKPPPPGYEDRVFATPTSDSDIETPEPETGGASFQDLTADSDFSPETPEIGPGPDSDIDTPMFDSAFGGGHDFENISDTSTPTQAMETPMFGLEGSGGEEPGFDEGAFGGIQTPAFDQGTPIPDFSPDTGVPISGAQEPLTEVTKGKKKKAKGGGGGGKPVLIMILLLIGGLAVGIFGGPYLSKWAPIPNPLKADVESAQVEIASLEKQVAQLKTIREATSEGQVEISPEQVEKLTAEQEQLSLAIKGLQDQQAQLQAQIGESNAQLTGIEQDIEATREKYVDLQDQLTAVENDIAIKKARQEGLNAEIERLTDQVGELEQANARRSATKDALLANLDRLIVGIREGLPLTPSKYAHAERLTSANDLRTEVENAKWVTPELVDRYTSIYLKELQIATAREYFFAKITVNDRFGTTYNKWAECLMNGNWSVYYRTLDGKNIGIYENVGTTEEPLYGFREELPPDVQKAIELTVVSHRASDFEEKVAVLSEKENLVINETPFQRIFNSL